METLVLCDDLAVSVGLHSPDFGWDVTHRVVELLSSLAIRRHGATAVLRGLSRPQRAPGSISAF